MTVVNTEFEKIEAQKWTHRQKGRKCVGDQYLCAEHARIGAVKIVTVKYSISF